MINILSFDVEDWHQVAYQRLTGRLREPGTALFRQLDFLLQVLADHGGTKATFFVLGIVAEKHPDLVRLIANQGHEIASHGYAHLLVKQLSRDGFTQDTLKSKLLLEDIIGLPVEGYRAPEFSIRTKSLWALSVLAELGFKYDSSIFPIYHRRYGIPGFSPEVARYDTQSGAQIVEFPLTTFPFWRVRLPIAGGGYVRLTPFPILRFALRRNVRTLQPIVTYFHPAEFEKQRLNVFDLEATSGCKEYLRGLIFNIHQNIGHRTMRSKLSQFLKCFRFTTCRTYLEEANLHDSRKLLSIAS